MEQTVDIMMSVCAAELVHPSSVSHSFVFRNAVKSKSMIILLQFLVRMLRCWFKWRGQLLETISLAESSHSSLHGMAWLRWNLCSVLEEEEGTRSCALALFHFWVSSKENLQVLF